MQKTYEEEALALGQTHWGTHIFHQPAGLRADPDINPGSNTYHPREAVLPTRQLRINTFQNWRSEVDKGLKLHEEQMGNVLASARSSDIDVQVEAAASSTA